MGRTWIYRIADIKCNVYSIRPCRHIGNLLAFYHIIKRLGLPDSNIIIMTGDDMACSPRNPYPACIYHNESHMLNLYDDTVEVSVRRNELMTFKFE